MQQQSLMFSDFRKSCQGRFFRPVYFVLIEAHIFNEAIVAWCQTEPSNWNVKWN